MSSPEEPQQSILSQALICFSEAHFHKVSMAQIAQQAGISEAELKNHYASKPQLLLALVQNVEQDLDDIISEHAPDLECWQDVSDMLLIQAQLYVEEEIFSRYFTLLMFHLDLEESLQPVHDYLSKQEWAQIQDIAEVLAKERAKGSFKAYLSDGELAQTIYAAWEGVLTHAFYHRELETVLRRVKTTLDMLFEGLRSGAAVEPAD